MSSHLRRRTAICGATLSVLFFGSSASAVIVDQSVVIPFSFPFPSATTDHSFSVDGFDPVLGTLNSVRVSFDWDANADDLEWTFRNDTSEAFKGFFWQRASISLRRGTNQASLGVSSQLGSTTFDFTVPAGQTSTQAFTGMSGAGSSNLNATNRSYFQDAGPVSLLLRTTGIDIDSYAPLTLVSSTGSASGSATVNISYRYQPSHTTARKITISSSVAAPIQQSGCDWYVFEYATGELTIDTLGSVLFNEIGQNGNDTELALYDAAGNRITENDDISDSNFLSRLTFADGELAPGTYYIAIGGFNATFGSSGFTVSSNSMLTGNYQLNLTGTPVPEPASFGLVGAMGWMVRRRR